MSLSLEDLSQRVDLLSVQVEDLTEAFARLRLELRRRDRPPAGLLSQVGGAASAATSLVSSGYNDLASEIPPVEDSAVALCGRLSGGTLSARQRASRAWECGWWARFVLQGRLARPRPPATIDLANSRYIVLKAEGFVCPLYWFRGPVTTDPSWVTSPGNHSPTAFHLRRKQESIVWGQEWHSPPPPINGARRREKLAGRSRGALCAVLASYRHRNGRYFCQCCVCDYEGGWRPSTVPSYRLFAVGRFASGGDGKRVINSWSSHHFVTAGNSSGRRRAGQNWVRHRGASGGRSRGCRKRFDQTVRLHFGGRSHSILFRFASSPSRSSTAPLPGYRAGCKQWRAADHLLLCGRRRPGGDFRREGKGQHKGQGRESKEAACRSGGSRDLAYDGGPACLTSGGSGEDPSGVTNQDGPPRAS